MEPLTNAEKHYRIRSATRKNVPAIAKIIKGLAEYLGETEHLQIGEKGNTQTMANLLSPSFSFKAQTISICIFIEYNVNISAVSYWFVSFSLELLRDGFGERPLFHCLVAEEVRHDEVLDPAIFSNGGATTVMIPGVAIYFYTYFTWEGPMLYLEDLFVIPFARGTPVSEILQEDWCGLLGGLGPKARATTTARTTRSKKMFSRMAINNHLIAMK
ncbi:predicted protein [Nematostella vectensis]|uniref:Diamine N-acetyltransferase n=1 Tax=Nematostella vectensis TaxID=45351 RepID=A7RTZ2_NEMVE|nr:predicted protein [Nematostella vectensis]|eukprot:XP_001637234.1 predicted protein [Nematostella vectensis]